MDEQSLIKAAFIAALAGILLLLFISVLSEPQLVQYSSIVPDTSVRLRGLVTGVSGSGEATFIQLAEIRHITVVAFSNITLANNSLIEVRGSYRIYKGKEEIIADSIFVIE